MTERVRVPCQRDSDKVIKLYYPYILINVPNRAARVHTPRLPHFDLTLFSLPASLPPSLPPFPSPSRGRSPSFPFRRVSPGTDTTRLPHLDLTLLAAIAGSERRRSVQEQHQRPQAGSREPLTVGALVLRLQESPLAQRLRTLK